MYDQRNEPRVIGRRWVSDHPATEEGKRDTVSLESSSAAPVCLSTPVLVANLCLAIDMLALSPLAALAHSVYNALTY